MEYERVHETQFTQPSTVHVSGDAKHLPSYPPPPRQTPGPVGAQ
jgi:hypothetical protein